MWNLTKSEKTNISGEESKLKKGKGVGDERAECTKKSHVNETIFAYFTNKKIEVKKVQYRDYVEEGSLNNMLEKDKSKHALLAVINKDPNNYEEAMSAENRLEWKKAIKEELTSMDKSKLWKITERPKIITDGIRVNIIMFTLLRKSEIVIQKKIEEDGESKCTARLVIIGFKDRKEYEL